jgi:hypothetical protein
MTLKILITLGVAVLMTFLNTYNPTQPNDMTAFIDALAII